MKHISIPIDQTCEFINITSISPLISKCQIKVCYVSDEPNRNRSVITKETAEKLAETLRGCPIVGYYNEYEEDFEEHNHIAKLENGKWVFNTNTKPYGFVDINAKVWFQKFLDDNQFEREYLVTEGFIWTGQFPESQRIINKGNNQSMEIDEDTLDATWVRDVQGRPHYFIINDGIISKLCVLGEEEEPCFEGSQIKVHFSLDQNQDFNNILFSMRDELQKILEKGGQEEMPNQEELNLENQETLKEEVSTGAEDFAKKEDEEEKKEEAQVEEKEKSEEDKKDDQDEKEKEEDEKKKASYSLEDVQDILAKFSEAQSQLNEITRERDSLLEEVTTLRTFKSEIELKDKEAMIDSFYMLSDEDKADVKANINTYSLDDIEAKLSILCVRNRVSFNLNEDKETEKMTTTFSLDPAGEQTTAPSWVQALDRVSNNK